MAVKNPEKFMDGYPSYRTEMTGISRLSVTENLEPLSTAEIITTQADISVIPHSSFMEIYDHHGSLGIYRVAAVREDFGYQQVISLEHSIVTLEDDVAPDEAALTGTMSEILSTILSWQTTARWSLGRVDVPGDQTYTLDCSNQIVLQALLDAVGLVYGYHLSFDQSGSTWVVNLVVQETSNSFTLDAQSSLSTISVTYDSEEYCSRVVHPLLPNGELVDDTYGAIIGTVTRPLDAPTDATEEQVLQLAQTYLAAHNFLGMTAEMDGMELGADRIRPGMVGTVVWPQYDMNAKEVVCTVHRPDVYNAPEQVRVTMISQRRSTSSMIAGLRKSVGKVKRDSAAAYRYIKEELDKIVIEAPTIELIARVDKLEETANGLELQFNEVMIRLDAAEATLLLKASQTALNEVDKRVSNAEILLNGAEAKINMKADQTTVDTLTERVSAAEIGIDGANALINLKASQTSVDSLGKRVSAAEIAIDGANSRIDLKADLILLDGYVKASEFETKWLSVLAGASISTINSAFIGCNSFNCSGTASAGSVTATNMDAAYLSAVSMSLGGTSVSSYDLTMGSLVSSKVFAGGNINLAHSHAVSVGADGKVTLGEVSAEGGNFNIADTAFFKDAVAAAADLVTLSSDGWSGLTNTVRASNGKTYVVPFPEITLTGGDSFDSSNKTIVNATTPSSSAYITRLEVDASSVYTKGYNAGNDAGKSAWRPTIVTRTGVDTSAKTVTVSVSNLNQTLLTGQTVSCVEVYDAGFAAGWASAVSKISQDGKTIYGPTATVGSSGTLFTISVGGEISSIRNTAANTFFAQGQARAYINGSQVQYQSLTKTQTISVGQ